MSEKKSCCCTTSYSEEFMNRLDDDLKSMILDDSTAPELFSSGEEIFGAYEKHQLPLWAEASWNLHKEVINSTIYGGWENETHPWDREIQDFWKYPIAFASYGIPSLVMIDPSYYAEACDILKKSLMLLKEAGSFDEWTRLEFGKDPVTTKNVMYKGHLNLVYGLYRLLTGSDEFDVEYHNMMDIIATESIRNARDHGFYGIECEPDQYFPPCNSIALLSEKVYDLNYGTNYAKEIAEPVADFIRRKMVDPETGFTMFRYHPLHDYAEPYIMGDQAWTLSTLHYFSKEQCEKGFESAKRELFADLKGGTEVYLKPSRSACGISTDYEQSTMGLYGPLMSREFGDVDLYEKITRFFNDMYDATCCPNCRIVGYPGADPGVATHMEGYFFLGAVHLGFEKVFDFDWAAFREEHKKELEDYKAAKAKPACCEGKEA